MFSKLIQMFFDLLGGALGLLSMAIGTIIFGAFALLLLSPIILLIMAFV